MKRSNGNADSSAFNTVRPPTPESNTPIGASFDWSERRESNDGKAARPEQRWPAFYWLRSSLRPSFKTLRQNPPPNGLDGFAGGLTGDSRRTGSRLTGSLRAGS